ncbi:MAG: translocase [Candidatus Aminicenantes bacterium]|nr:translocase [Candidatus Aminicenantes bacterium]
MNLPLKGESGSNRLASGMAVSKALGLFAKLYPGEAPTALLLTLNIYLIFMSYYLIKPVREALILAGKGAEIKSYLSAATAVSLIFVVKAFSSIASHVSRQRLITWVTLFFISNLVLFYFLSVAGVDLGTMGVIFYVWIGIFNLLVPAQFWGFANDIYSAEEGKRLFPLVAIGATFGSFSGSAIFGWLVKPIGLYQMMLVSGAILLVCILLTRITHLRELRKALRPESQMMCNEKDSGKELEKPLKKGGGFKLVFKRRYLIYIAFFVLILNYVNTNGEYILGKYITREAPKIVETGQSGGLNVEEYIGKFYSGFFKYVNFLALIIQLFVVSRVFKWIGVRGALFVLPFIALGGYAFVAAGISLLIVKWVKIFENGTDYSLMNTTRHALFLITSREEKYKAKAAIDTFFQRAGDLLSGLIVFLGTTYFAFNVSKFASFNVVLIFIWIVLGILIVRQHKLLYKSAC